MNLFSSISHGLLFLLMFALLAGGDWLLKDQQVASQTFYIEQDNVDEIAELLLETDKTLSTASVPEKVINDLIHHVQNGKSIVHHQWFTTSNGQEKQMIIDQVLAALAAQKQYNRMLTFWQAHTLFEQQSVSTAARFYHALALSRVGQTEQAILAYHQLIDQMPNHQSATVNLGILYRETGQLQKSIFTLEQGVKISSGEKKAKALSLLASNYRDQNLRQQAANYYQKSIEYRPTHAATWLKLADTQASLGLPVNDVIKTYQRAIALAPGLYRPLLAAGQYAYGQNQLVLAEQWFSQAQRLASEHQKIREGLAWTYTIGNNWDLAKDHWHWLQHNATSKHTRLLAQHLYNLTTYQSSEHLKSLEHKIIAQQNGKGLLLEILKRKHLVQTALPLEDITRRVQALPQQAKWRPLLQSEISKLNNGLQANRLSQVN